MPGISVFFAPYLMCINTVLLSRTELCSGHDLYDRNVVCNGPLSFAENPQCHICIKPSVAEEEKKTFFGTVT